MQYFVRVIEFLKHHLTKGDETAASWVKKDGFVVEEQKDLPLWFKGVRLQKTYRMYIVLNGKIILELKATEATQKEHRLQLFSYLRLTHFPIGILLNFTLDKGLHFEKYYYDEASNRCIAFK